MTKTTEYSPITEEPAPHLYEPDHEFIDSDFEDELHHLSPTDLYKKENVAIAMSYFAVGFVSSFITTPLNIYMVDVLDAEPAIQSTIGILQTLPWSLKLIFGFVSDAFPIAGMHRKPYLTMGALIYSFAYLMYSFINSDSVILLATAIFFGTLGLIELDVMADTMCIERSKFEGENRRGQLQASCYSIRFGGGLIGALLGTSLSNRSTWGWGLTFHQAALVNGLVPFLLVAPWLYVLREKYHKFIVEEGDVELPAVQPARHMVTPRVTKKWKWNDSTKHKVLKTRQEELPGYQESDRLASTAVTVPAVKRSPSHAHIELSADDDDRNETHPVFIQLNEIWETVQLQAVWRPMAFVYLYNFLQVPNVAWQSYLQLSLNFPPWVLGLTVTLGSFMTFAGVLAYKYLFFRASWKSIYVWTSLLTAFFSLLQMLLIFQINTKYLHLSNYLFSLGDDVISAYISGIQFLPVCVMYMRLCPDGSEGASYSMLTTFSNIALVCASNLGNMLSGVWDVSNDAMRNNDVSGLWKLSILTTVLQCLPLTLLWLLPRDAEEQERLAKSKSKSKLGGIVFLSVLSGSLLWSISTAISRLSATDSDN